MLDHGDSNWTNALNWDSIDSAPIDGQFVFVKGYYEPLTKAIRAQFDPNWGKGRGAWFTRTGKLVNAKDLEWYRGPGKWNTFGTDLKNRTEAVQSQSRKS